MRAWAAKAKAKLGWGCPEVAALVAKWAKSNFSLSDTETAVSKLLELVSEGLSSLLVGLFGGECLATVEKADFSFLTSKWALLRTDNWWGRWVAAKRLL